MRHGDLVWRQGVSELTVMSVFCGRGAPVGMDLGVFNFQDLLHKQGPIKHRKKIKHKSIIDFWSCFTITHNYFNDLYFFPAFPLSTTARSKIVLYLVSKLSGLSSFCHISSVKISWKHPGTHLVFSLQAAVFFSCLCFPPADSRACTRNNNSSDFTTLHYVSSRESVKPLFHSICTFIHFLRWLLSFITLSTFQLLSHSLLSTFISQPASNETTKFSYRLHEYDIIKPVLRIVTQDMCRSLANKSNK